MFNLDCPKAISHIGAWLDVAVLEPGGLQWKIHFFRTIINNINIPEHPPPSTHSSKRVSVYCTWTGRLSLCPSTVSPLAHNPRNFTCNQVKSGFSYRLRKVKCFSDCIFFYGKFALLFIIAKFHNVFGKNMYSQFIKPNMHIKIMTLNGISLPVGLFFYSVIKGQHSTGWSV